MPVFCAIIFSVVWTPVIGSWFAGIFTGEIDGGNEPPPGTRDRLGPEAVVLRTIKPRKAIEGETK